MRLSVSHERELEDRLCRLSKAKATGGGAKMSLVTVVFAA